LELPSWSTDQMFEQAAELRLGWARGKEPEPPWLY
jgi:hypothetical protein